MSVSLDTLGSIKFKGFSTSSGTITMTCPVIDGDTTLSLGRKSIVPYVGVDLALKAVDSGSIVALDLTAGGAHAITFPAPLAGMNYLFVVKTAGANVCTITGTFSGYVINNATRLACATKANIATTATTLVGDSLEVFCPVDGLWCVRGFGGANASFA